MDQEDDSDIVVVNDSRIHEAMDKAEAILVKSRPYAIFQQGSRLVRIIKIPTTDILGDKNIVIENVNQSFLLDLFNRHVTFLDEKGQPIDPPNRIAARYLSRSGKWKVRILTGIIFAPTIRPDGTLLQNKGYDSKTGIYFADTRSFNPLPDELDYKDAERALIVLRRILMDFPFRSNEDESVILAAILTSLVRKSFPTAPLFGITAPTAGSGKTLLANIISIIATGMPAIATPYGKDKEEERKKLFSKLLQGKPVILIDNIEQPVDSETLCAIITAPGGSYSDRILGRSEIIEVPTNVTFIATGNNLVFQGDMTRRALLCTIDPQTERPENREGFIIKDLENYVKTNRERLVNAGLTILKAYIDAAKPKQDIPQYGSFEMWSEWIRGALVWLGCSDPYLTKKNIEKDDPIKANLSKIMMLWLSVYGSQPVKVSEIVVSCNKALSQGDLNSDVFELGQALLEVTRTRGNFINGESVGKWLRSNKDRIMDGYRIVKDPYSEKLPTAKWILEGA